MTTIDEIRELSLDNRLSMMEALWESLSSNEDQVPVLQWQKDLLDEREKLIERGEAHFIDWEIAKQQIQEELFS